MCEPQATESQLQQEPDTHVIMQEPSSALSTVFSNFYKQNFLIKMYLVIKQLAISTLDSEIFRYLMAIYMVLNVKTNSVR